MKIIPTKLAGVLIIEPKVWRDQRGFFLESYNRRTFAEHGIDLEFVQDNHSRSCRGTLRGMHYQAPPAAQDKLVRAIAGSILDAVVDLRRSSPTFGAWITVELSAENQRSLLVPKGFAHGFCVLSDFAEIIYKCSQAYAPEFERGLQWNDPAVGIDWPVATPLLSERDQHHPPLDALPPDFV